MQASYIRTRGGSLALVRRCDTRKPCVAPMEAFARAWHEENRGKWLEVDYLGGFCLLIKRQLLDQIGPLEAKAGLNIFDTDSLCLKMRKAGYSLACCKDLFIHNFASRG